MRDTINKVRLPTLFQSKVLTPGLSEDYLDVGVLKTLITPPGPVWALELYFLPKQLGGAVGSNRKPGLCAW